MISRSYSPRFKILVEDVNLFVVTLHIIKVIAFGRMLHYSTSASAPKWRFIHTFTNCYHAFCLNRQKHKSHFLPFREIQQRNNDYSFGCCLLSLYFKTEDHFYGPAVKLLHLGRSLHLAQVWGGRCELFAKPGKGLTLKLTQFSDH